MIHVVNQFNVSSELPGGHTNAVIISCEENRLVKGEKINKTALRKSWIGRCERKAEPEILNKLSGTPKNLG